MPKTLLLVDDSLTIQRVIELTFADEDIKVIALSDGDQAIRRLNADPPDIVLADVGMPGKNGYEVAQYIKSTPALAHIPVVLLTGAFEPVDQARATAAGCDGVLAKPFEPQLVIGRVKQLLARPREEVAALDVTLSPPVSETEPWTPPLADPAFNVESKPIEAAQADYFDRLDEAFANLGTTPQPPSKRAAQLPAASSDWFTPTTPQPAFEDDDGLSLGPDTFGDRAEDLPLVPAQTPAPVAPPARRAQPVPPPPAAARTPSIAAAPRTIAPASPASASPSVQPTRPSAPAGPPPPIAETFAALLAAELNEPTPAVAPVWPRLAAAPAVDTDAFVEQVVERVIARLSDQAVRDTVSEIVSKAAERLVKEEIDRIKALTK